MSQKKIIAVIGATGAQGGNLIRAILEDPNSEFAVRAITRNADSEKAKALAAQGVEVVEADMNDVASLTKAFEGAYGAYCVTSFWEHFDPNLEMSQAKNMAQAAKATGLQHVIWSTLEDVRKWVPLESDQLPTLNGNYKVPHFDAKGEADHFFTDAGVPTTFYMVAFYWDNMIHFGSGPQRGPDGKLMITFPMGDKKLPGISIEDIGRCAYGIFKRGGEYIGKRVGVAGEQLTGEEMAAALSETLGEPVGYWAVEPETYRNFGFPGAADLGNMFQFHRDFNDYFLTARDHVIARELNPQLKTLKEWLAENGSKIPVPAAVG
ncbi:MAG: NmrA/HSCARG family protein [Fimbriimonadaceae bacterium]|nr:NmrA/HSCARG family protein [Fimbriimonadaceae bacterium]